MEAWQFMKRVNVLRNRFDRYGIFINIRFGRNDCVDIDIHLDGECKTLKWNFMKTDSVDIIDDIQCECRRFIYGQKSWRS